MTTRSVAIALALTALGVRLAAVPSAKAATDAEPPPTPTVAKVPAGKRMTGTAIPLPGGGADGIFMDYLACDRAKGVVYVPAGNTGSLDLIETRSHKVTRIEGFATAAVERRGRKRIVGPSSATIADGVVYVGNRADSTVCAVDTASRRKGACATLDSMPDGVAWVATTKEVWVTTPRDRTLTILDASKAGALAVKQTMKLEGSPEGYAVDAEKGVFYTNLEDKDRTLAIDVRKRAVLASWEPKCGEEGPRGLAVDPVRGLLFVACTESAVALDLKHDGAVRSRLATGAGVDNIDYLPATHQLYVAAGQGHLIVARAADDGTLTTLASGTTAEGARVVVADAKGGAYVADSRGGRILYFPPI